MITVEQLDQLEGRIVKALEIISDLRIENSQLESKADSLEANNEELKIKTDEKIKAAEQLEQQLKEATTELSQLRSKEQEIETKILQIIAKLDNVKGSTVTESTSPSPITETSNESEPSSDELDQKETFAALGEPDLPDQEAPAPVMESPEAEIPEPAEESELAELGRNNNKR